MPIGGPIPVGANLLRIEFDLLRRAGTDGQAGLVVAGDTGFVGQLTTRFDPTFSALGNTNNNTPLQPFADDIFHQMVMELDLVSLKMEGFIDGVSTGLPDINNATTPSSITTLQFQVSGPNTSIFIDNVRVSETTVPEPTTLALMGVGLAGISYRRKLSKR